MLSSWVWTPMPRSPISPKYFETMRGSWRLSEASIDRIGVTAEVWVLMAQLVTQDNTRVRYVLHLTNGNSF